MKISEVEKIALKLMGENGMHAPYWKLKFINRKSVAGRCYKSNWNGKRNASGRIELSIPFMEAFDEAEVRETILHEIAHGLTDPRFKPHGPEWKANAKKIGSNGSRCVSVDAPKIKSRYLGTCPNGHEFTRHKKSEAITGNFTYCPPCSKKMPSGQYAFITWQDTETGRIMNPGKPVVQSTVVSVAAKSVKKSIGSVKKTGLDTSKPRTLSWKEKYDAGMTSFDNDW